MDGFVDAVIASPLGVSWLAVLEAVGSGGEKWPAMSPIADPAVVSAAVDLIGEMSFGRLVESAVFAGVFESGPWMGDAPDKIAAASAQAERRAPIAEAVSERFGEQLHAPIDRDSQQWFTDGDPWLESRAPLFDRFDDVYGAGEFPVGGLRGRSTARRHTTAAFDHRIPSTSSCRTPIVVLVAVAGLRSEDHANSAPRLTSLGARLGRCPSWSHLSRH